MSLFTVAKSLAGVRGLGYRPNPEKKRNEKPDRVFVPWPAARKAKAGAPALRECVPPRFNQGATSSCVTQAIGGAVSTHEMYLSQHMARSEARKDLFHASLFGQLSRRALYSLSRATHGDERNDGGTYIRAALQELRRHGCPLELDVPWSEVKINAKVPLSALHKGYALAELEYEGIFAAGDQKLELIAAAVAEGFPVVFGATIGESFQRYRGGIYEPTRGDIDVGGHAMYIVDIVLEGAELYALVVNSWGERWGESGFIRVHLEFVRRRFRDLTIIKNWRRVQAAEKELLHAA